MEREQLKKHWDVIEAFKNGAVIQFKDLDEKWKTISDPDFLKHNQYRVKPKFCPKMGDKILVEDDHREVWLERIFIENDEEGYYICLEGAGSESIFIQKQKKAVNIVHWKKAKPLNS